MERHGACVWAGETCAHLPCLTPRSLGSSRTSRIPSCAAAAFAGLPAPPFAGVLAASGLGFVSGLGFASGLGFGSGLPGPFFTGGGGGGPAFGIVVVASSALRIAPP